VPPDIIGDDELTNMTGTGGADGTPVPAITY
jgi:hypothetical protein